MLFLFSKIIRQVNKIKTPYKCYAELYIVNKNNICDCIDKCKFDPPARNINLYKNNIKLHKNQYI